MGVFFGGAPPPPEKIQVFEVQVFPGGGGGEVQVFRGRRGRGEAEKVQVFEVQVFESVPGGEPEKAPVFEKFPGGGGGCRFVFLEGGRGSTGLLNNFRAWGRRACTSKTCTQTCITGSAFLKVHFFGGGGGRWGGWEGEEPVLQKPVPKPVLEQVFVVHFVFGVGGWVGCSPCHRKICKGNLRISSTIGSLKFPPKTNSWGDFRKS